MENEQTAQQTEDSTEVNWQSKFEGQRKVNRDLENKLNEAYRKADRVDELEKQLAMFQGKEKEYAQAQEREKIQADAIAKANQRVLKADIRAAAAGKLVNPADALRFIDISDLTVSDDGEVDSEAIEQKINDLVEQHPYLAQGGNKAGQTGIIPPSGARDGDHAAGQLTRDDLRTMTPAQINEARLKGRLRDLMTGKTK